MTPDARAQAIASFLGEGFSQADAERLVDVPEIDLIERDPVTGRPFLLDVLTLREQLTSTQEETRPHHCGGARPVDEPAGGDHPGPPARG